jgi:hypothetical protein
MRSGFGDEKKQTATMIASWIITCILMNEIGNRLGGQYGIIGILPMVGTYMLNWRKPDLYDRYARSILPSLLLVVYAVAEAFTVKDMGIGMLLFACFVLLLPLALWIWGERERRQMGLDDELKD